MCVNAASTMEVSSSSVSRSREIRKIRKPLMEKKRRARINSSLDALQRILSEAEGKDLQQIRSTKLEKADILEMTVRHLHNLNKQSKSSPKCACSAIKVTDNYGESIDTRKNLSINYSPAYSVTTSEGRAQSMSQEDKNINRMSSKKYYEEVEHRLQLNQHDCSKNRTIRNNENIDPMIRADILEKTSNSRAFIDTESSPPNHSQKQNSNLISLDKLTLVPVHLSDGTLAFVVPSTSADRNLSCNVDKNNRVPSNRSADSNLFCNDYKDNRVPTNYNSVWRPWF